ncbi:unnamed protein product [Sphagnum balticum]
MITLPTLYKKSSSGKIQEWTIGVEKSTIITVHGQTDGKKQTTQDVIKEGKNLGKSNETTPEEQALAEATSKWEGKIKKGYVEDVNRAAVGEKDIDGGFDPMLAHKFADHGHKIKYPAYIQPKLNGHRCLAIITDGVCTLWSRTRKPITSMPHIVKELENVYKTGTHELDGELYNHDYRDRFEDLASFIRQEVPKPGCEVVEYHLYDQRSDGGFGERIAKLRDKIHCYEKVHGLLTYVKFTETLPAKDEDEMMSYFEHFLKNGYEGGMARNSNGLYEGKRSYNLQKIKSFVDDEFSIVGIKEETGGLTEECSLLSAHFAVCDASFNILDELELFTKPNDGYYNVSAEALGVNKINLIEHDKVAKTYSEAGQELRNFLWKYSQNGKIKLVPVGKNVGFDVLKINNTILGKKTWSMFTSYRLYDITGLVIYLKRKGKLPLEAPDSLSKLAEYFGIQGEWHTARGDNLAGIEMSKASREIECLMRLDELVASYDAILEFMQSEDLVSREESRAIRSSSEIAKMIFTRLASLRNTGKVQLLEYSWEMLPIERIKLTIVTDRNSKEFSYNH